MCGIAGIYQRGGRDVVELRAAARRMSDCLRHRGPDDEGVFADAGAGVALGFRRLAIIDLSPAGAQPMASRSGRYTLIFNGEMYNFERLRRELDGPWRGHSDTEVILAAFEAWGVRAAVERFIGMFAFAVWDARERTLILGRDRAGVKPLYLAATSDCVLFASEIKALGVTGDIDSGAFALYARYGYVPAPYAMVEGVRKVRPATLVTIDADLQMREETYWNAREIAETVVPFRGDETEAIAALDELLADSVSLRMIADVPLGVFLSGGIDSSVVTAQMARGGQTVKSYTIGFEDRAFDEAEAAAAVARHFGTSHTQLYARAEDAQEALTRMPEIFDEPLGDTSQVPTYLVARLARPHVTVALSGDGGDELFGGYSHYYLRRQLQRRAERIPALARRPVGAALRAASKLAKGRMRERLASYGGALGGEGLVAQWLQEMAETRLTRLEAPPFILTTPASWPALRDPSAMQMWLDFMAYLPDDILPKVDRATMAVSLEAREPLLDHRLIEFAWSLPPALRDRKRILREVLCHYLPRALVDREKRGFGLPIGAWLRGPLREWVESLLPRDDAYFDAAAVRGIWDEHLRGEEHAALIWRVLMFEGWRSKLNQCFQGS